VIAEGGVGRIIVILTGMLLFTAGAANAVVPSPVAVASTFFDAIKAGQQRAAYDSLSPLGRQQETYFDFRAETDKASSSLGFSSTTGRTLTFAGPYDPGRTIACFTERPPKGTGSLVFLVAIVNSSVNQVEEFQISSEPFSFCAK
jgi:uncharacterized protein YbjT (DUF2867 family)